MELAEHAPTCCACSGLAVARVLDGAFRKPVCAVHVRLYGERGYVIVDGSASRSHA